jgi:hypothetical protein
LRRYIVADPERADDQATLIPQRHLRRQDPPLPATGEGFPLHLPGNRPAGLHDLVLVLESGGSMVVSKDLEIRFPGQFLRGAAGSVRGEPARTDEQGPAQPVPEIHPRIGGKQILHAQQLEQVWLAAAGWRHPPPNPPCFPQNTITGL